MATPAESTIEWVRGWHRDIANQLHTLGNRISAWLILGNAAALVLVFNAIIEPVSCARDLVLPAAWYFVAGLGLAFVGALASYLLSLAGLNLVGKLHDIINQLAVNEYYIAKLESEGVEVPEDAPLQVQITEAAARLEPLKKKLPVYWAAFWAVAAVFFVSAGMFAAGVLSPLSEDIPAACSLAANQNSV